MSKKVDKTALALEVVRQIKPGYHFVSSGMSMGGHQAHEREKLSSAEEKVYGAALDVLYTALKGEGK